MAKSKMTWAKLANDPTISANELPRIAKAFGLKKPTRATMQSEEGDKPKKSTAKKPTAKTPTTAQPRRERKYTKAKSKSTASQSLRERKYSTDKPTAVKSATKSTKKMETPKDAGPEQAYKKRVKVVKTGGGTKNSGTMVVAVKPKRVRGPRTSGPGGRRG